MEIRGVLFCFFFQAEDGIRDVAVTGVQTCALPICEFTEPYAIMEQALAEAGKAGVFGDLRIHLHRGAGAYICGEETAMMNSIEGKRGNPRIKPPFPAAFGVFGMPTTINNVETLAAVPHIIKQGAAWYKAMSLSNPKSTGTKLFSVCGHVQRPGNYEVTMGFPLKSLLYDLCGGQRLD